MSYKITARVFRTNTNAFFRIVEKTVFLRGTWAEVDEQHVLTMDSSGTSGTLRFKPDGAGEEVVVALGVHNYKRWGDIVTNLTDEQTGVVINPQYYDGTADRAHARESQRSEYSVKNLQGRNFTVNYTVNEGNDLRANIIIG